MRVSIDCCCLRVDAGDFCCPGHSFTPEPVRWGALPPLDATKSERMDFVQSLVTLAGTGNPFSTKGMAIHTFNCNIDMGKQSLH